MDTEKVLQADASVQDLPFWMYCRTCRATQKRNYILKWIFSITLVALLAMNIYQSVHASRLKFSSLQLEQQYTTSVEAHGHHNLSLVVGNPSETDDTNWKFTVYGDRGCTGTTDNGKGDEIAPACVPFDEAYKSINVPTLGEDLKICFYENDDCSGKTTPITTTQVCYNMPPAKAYKVLESGTSCNLQVMI